MSYVKFNQIPLDLNWHEGMSLSPHQFQQNDLRFQQTIGAHCNFMNPYHYGICSISIDNISLSNGIFRLNSVDAIFQDGLILSYNPKINKHIKIIEVNLSSMPEDVYEFFIYLCIAEYSEDVSPILGNPARYYSIEGPTVSDFNVKDLVAKLPRLYPNAFLHAGNSVPEFCIGFPIAKLSRSENLFKIKDWSYPRLLLEQDSKITKRCIDIATSAREKAMFLSEKLKTQIGGVTSYDIESLLVKLMMILPTIEGIASMPNIRPYDLYTNLLHILGCVSTLIPSELPPVLSPYNHNDIDSSFGQLISMIEYYMSAIERGFTIKQFSRDENFYFTMLSKEELKKFRDGKIFVGIRGSGSMGIEKINAWMESAVIVSDFAIQNVRSRRIKGAKRTKADRERVLEITPGVGVVLFEIDIDVNYIASDERLHIFNQGASKNDTPNELIMYIPRLPGE